MPETPDVDPAMTTLQVRRRFDPDTANPWTTQRAYEATVWEFDGTAAVVHPVVVRRNYAPGILTCYVNQVPVDLRTFATALQTIGITLGEMHRAIHPGPPDT